MIKNTRAVLAHGHKMRRKEIIKLGDLFIPFIKDFQLVEVPRSSVRAFVRSRPRSRNAFALGSFRRHSFNSMYVLLLPAVVARRLAAAWRQEAAALIGSVYTKGKGADLTPPGLVVT